MSSLTNVDSIQLEAVFNESVLYSKGDFMTGHSIPVVDQRKVNENEGMPYSYVIGKEND